MNVRQKLEHAKEYGYPVRIETEDGNRHTDKVGEVRPRRSRIMEVVMASGPRFAIDTIVSVEIACDHRPDVEVAEIGRDERWMWSWRDCKGPKWEVSARDGARGNVFLRKVGNFEKGVDAKATALLPELVKQRDKLLEVAKAVTEWLTHYPRIGTLDSLEDSYHALHETVCEIEKYPLIRFVDAE